MRSLYAAVTWFAIGLMGWLGASTSVAQEYGQYQEDKTPPGHAMVMTRSKEKASEPWVHQVFQNGVAIDPARNYTLTFWAKGTQDAQGHVSGKLNQEPWAFLKLRHDFVLDSQWHLYTIKFPGEGAVPGNSRLTFNFRGSEPMDMWIADVQLVETGGDGTNLITNGKFDNGLRGWTLNGHNDGNFTVKIAPVSEQPAN